MNCYLLTLSFLLFASCAFAGDPANTSLVRAKVKSVGEVTKNSSVATLEVVHVYAGEPRLVGQMFRDTQAFEHSAGYPATARFEVDEEGIWSLLEESKGLLPRDVPAMPFRIRSRKADNSRHAQAIALAEAVEKYSQAKPDARSAMLQSLALDETPEVSAWAVRSIPSSTTSDTEVGKILDGLLNEERLPRLGQIALDEILCERKGKEWQTAETRLKRLRSWVAEKADEFDATASIRRIDLAAQKRQLKDETAVELAQVAARNSKLTTDVRREAMNLIGRIAKATLDYSAPFTFLAAQVEKADEKELRWAAALNIRNFIPLDAEKVKRVQQLADQVTDPDVTTVLKEALAKTKR